MPSATTNNILTLSFVPLRAAFVNLPPSWAASLLDTQRTPNDFAVHLQWSETERRVRETYVSWAGGSSSSPVHQSSTPQKYRNGTNRVLGVLEIDPIYANAIGLKNGQEVCYPTRFPTCPSGKHAGSHALKVLSLVCMHSPPFYEKVTVRVLRSTLNATTVHVEPLTPDDWEILELHAGYVEEQLLNQVRVLCTNQVVVVWIHHRTTVKLRIVKTEPEGPYVKLNADTEVIVAPKQRRTSKKDDEANKDQTPPLSLRLLPFELLTGYTADSFDKTTTSMDTETFNLQLHPDDIPLHYKTEQIVRISKLEHAVATQMASKPSTPVQPDGDDQKSQKEGEGEYKEHSSLHLRVIENTSVLPGHAAVARIVREQLSLDWFDKILLQKPSVEPLQDYSITLQHTNLRMKSEDAKESFLEWISRLNHRPVLTDGAILLFHESENPLEALFLKVRLSSSRGGELESDSKGLYFILPDMERIDQDSINITDVTSLGEAIRINSESSPYLVPNLGGVNEIIDNAVCYCKARLSHPLISERLNLPVPGGVLLFSNHGGGKTSVTRSLTARLARDSQCFAYTRFVACTELAEARIPLVKAKLREAFDEASWREPSVIVFDDLDKLLPAEMENADSSRTKQLTECFLDMALTVCSRRRVVLLATAKHQQSLHPILVTSHLFSQLLHIPLPEKARRKQILESIVSSLPLQTMKASFESVDFLTVASTTEGYSPADLQTLVERAVHESAIRNASDEWIDPIVAKGKSDRTDSKSAMHGEVLTVEQTDFADAQNGFVPFSLRDVKLQKSDVRWADIGGMEETKRVLLETLEWPTKYAAIFASCPLRLRSGLLLYGYPGCGKTLLASAIAHECGLSFISVKGPELLNKYIGASEKSVRDLFERAQAAKPCVLFFDEFDSIAPRRGNDNTGVTDRVVNQLLTQMDGAEGLQGVYVLAATSRPELIDPALLRPGRLDKSLLCDMPNEEDRNDILRAQSAKVYLADDVDLAEFAKKTEGFSGADLQSLLSNGQLEAIHEVIDLDNGRVHEEKEGSTKVTDFVMVSNQGELKLTNAQRGKIGQRMSYLVEQRQQVGKKTSATTKPKFGALEFEKQSEIVITRSQLLRALENTKPSLSAVERRRFEAIYRSFVSERGEGVKEKETGLSSHATGARSTLM